MASPFKDNVNSKVLLDHVEAYSRASRTCAQQLASIFADLELDSDEQRTELAQVCAQALNVWTQSVEDAASRRDSLRQMIEDALKEVARIRGQLGDDAIQSEIDFEVAQLQGSGERKSLRAWFDETNRNLEMWRSRRALRVQEYEDLQFEVKALKQQMGFPTAAPPGAPDITRSSLELLRLERDKMNNERERRLKRLETSLARLRAACQELGEDEKFAAAGVHVSLRAALSSGPEAISALANAHKQAGRGVGTVAGAAELQLDLSDATFLGLQRKVDSLALLKAEREAHAHELLQVLDSLWQALGMQEMADDRAIFNKLMSGQYRLHSKSLEKCMSEVRRLEGCKTQQMRDLITAKAKELMELCHTTHVPAPDLGPMLAEVSVRAQAEHSGGAGQLADVLAKLVHMLAEVRAIADKRQSICSLIVELEEARAEAAWLKAYETDGERYKGRDANRKLQRAIRAAKLRDRMPVLMDAVADATHEWSVTEGEPFRYDGQDYAGEVLEQVAVEIAQHEEEKASKVQSRRTSGTGVAAAGSRTPAASRPSTASGTRTPLSRAHLSYTTREDISAHLAVTPKQLQKRSSFGEPIRTPASRTKPAPATPTRSAQRASATPNPIKDKLSKIMAHQSHQHGVATLQRAKSPLPSPSRSAASGADSHSLVSRSIMSATGSDAHQHQLHMADVTSKLAALATSPGASEPYMSPSKGYTAAGDEGVLSDQESAASSATTPSKQRRSLGSSSRIVHTPPRH